MRACVVVGTRPEAIKLAPVIRRLRETGAVCLIINTGQHRDMCSQALGAFGLSADMELATMTPGQSLGLLTSKLFAALDSALASEPCDWVIVQGDTSSAMAGAMTAFYRRVRLAHVEAGLRTYDRLSPFPEEINRTIIAQVADLHFAPTQRAADNLARAGVAASAVEVTGNTVVDAIALLRPGLGSRRLDDVLPAAALAEIAVGRVALVTMHRRESFGAGIASVCEALRDLAARYPDLVIVCPVHPNPNIREPVMRLLSGVGRVHLVEPLPYLDIMALLSRATLVLTDSGGLQEEAPSFGKPLLILRDVTERPEAVEVGAARLVGTDRASIFQNACTLLDDAAAYARMAQAGNPFGDGRASERIAAALLQSRAPA